MQQKYNFKGTFKQERESNTLVQEMTTISAVTLAPIKIQF